MSVRTLRTVLPPACLLTLSLWSQAQTNPYGCHYFRNGRPHPVATAADRNQIEETIARSDTFDILHYDIQLDVTDYGGSTIKGITTVDFRALQPDLTHIRFDLFELTVDSVVSPSGPLTFTYDGQFLRVALPATMAEGDEAELTVYYGGDPHRDPEWGGFYFVSNYIYNLGIGISSIPPNFGKVWYPCFDSFVERATYTYHVKSAGTFRLQGQGNFIGEVQLGGDTVIRSFDLPQAIPTHLSAIAVADYAEHAYTHTGAFGDIPVTLRAKPADLTPMLSRFGNLGDAIDACEFWYGPYPYDKVGYVLTTDGALEIPTNVAYPQFMTTQTNANNRGLYTHELGHHWWGDQVTPFVHNDMWLKEGPAEYSGHLIEEWIGGQEGLLQAVKDNHFRVLREAHIDDEGFQALSPMPDAHIYGTHTYYKGASVMHNLRGYLGDELFRQGMRGVQISLAERTMTPQQFRDSLEAATGADLDAFFDAWVFAPGYSVFVVRDRTSTPVGDAFEVTIDVDQKLRGTEVFHQQVPLQVSFVSAEGEEFLADMVASGANGQYTFTVPFDPALVILNRYNRLNQARTAHERLLVPGVSFGSTQPFVDLIVYQTNLVDSTLLRMEHIWAGAGEDPAAPDVIEVSNTHYWDIGGLWPEGTILRGRLTYAGSSEEQLDVDLVAGDETDMLMVYRETPLDPWTVYPDQTVLSGDLFNGNGIVNLDVMRKGQYAFAKSATSIGLSEISDRVGGLSLFPVPTSDELTVVLDVPGQGTLRFDVLSLDGRLAMRSLRSATADGRHLLSVSDLPAAQYVLQVADATGRPVGARKFDVLR
jgi:aminopeptidase N